MTLILIRTRPELRGGMTQNGRPAQLGYRTKDDQLISLVDGQPLSTDDLVVSTKRPMPDQVEDDGVKRSMARRKKGELPKTYTCSVDDCDKLFNRPCDRTKHLKTHERPHKCSDADCVFNVKGFPTEKERDRHWSDRHDPDARTWTCYYNEETGCPYSSKREHNLKSHMEKAHGWTYVRSKGAKTTTNQAKPVTKGKAKAVVLPRPSEAPSSSAPTPVDFSSISPGTFAYLSPPDYTSPPNVPNADVGPSPMASFMDYDPNVFNPQAFTPDFTGHFNTDLLNNETSFVPPTFPYTPSLSDGRRASHMSSSNGTPLMPTPSMDFDMSFNDIPLTHPPTPADLDFRNSHFAVDKTWNAQPGSSTMSAQDTFILTDNMNNYVLPNGFGSDCQPMQYQEQPALRNDLAFTSPQNMNGMSYDQTYSGNLAFAGDEDFQLSQYITGTGINDPLFGSAGGIDGMGSQFNLNTEPEQEQESNPFASHYQELV